MREPIHIDQRELALHFSEGESKPRADLWRRLSRVMECVIYLLLALAALKLFGPEWTRREEIVGEKRRLDQILEAKSAEVARLRQEHDLLKADKGYLETVARDRLNLQKEGEHIIRIERNSSR
jgi:cell division protein FtsB